VRATLAPVSRSTTIGVLTRRLLAPAAIAVTLLAAVPMLASAQSPVASPTSVGSAGVVPGASAGVAASPAPSGADASPDVSGPVDSRSSGESPGVAGAPLFAAIVVVGLGAAAAAGTVVYLRLTHQD
jgi:hypothetical protein